MRRAGVYWIGLAALTVALAALPASAVHLSSGAGVPQPLLLRISGYVGGAPQGVPTLGAFTLGVGKTVVTLDLSGVQTLNGPLTEGPAALRQYDLYSPNVLVIGDPAVLRGLTDVAPHTQVTLFGYAHGGARRLYVVQVEPV